MGFTAHRLDVNPSGRGSSSSSPGTIRLQGSGFDLSLMLDNDPAKPTGGGARYDTQDRPEQTTLTVYDGEDLIKLDVPVLLDGWKARSTVKPLLDQVLALCHGTPGHRSPDFTATGAFPYSGRRFVMDGLPDFGDSAGEHDVLLRQALTLKLMEFQSPDEVKLERRDGANGAGGKTQTVTFTVTGDDMTLIKISTRLYGAPKEAKAIGDLNGIRDTRKKLKKGLVLRLPPTPVIFGASIGAK